MTKGELNAFRKKLEEQRAELSIGSREALAIESSSDEMDRIQHFTEREYAMNNLERTSRRLREVRAALERIEDNSFGICAECEGVISAKRLIVVPWVAMCIRCQEEVERAAAMAGPGGEVALEEAA